MKEKTATRTKQSFLHGALILTISMAVVKIIGALFKIPLANVLGGEGNGYFSSAYELYNPLSALATAGLPIAISKMVSESVAKGRFKDVKKIHKVSVPIFFITGSIGVVIMVLSTFIYAKAVNAPEVKYATLALAPTILFVCLMSIYRGYYEGLRNMTPTAVSEIIEAVCKLVLGLSLAYGVIAYGLNEYRRYGTVFGISYENEELARNATLPFAAAGAIMGISIGAVAGFLYLFIRFCRKGDGITQEELKNSPIEKSSSRTMRSLVNIAIPVGLGAIIMNFAGFIDSTLILRRLNDIMETKPMELLNCYSGFISEDIVARGNTHVFLYGCYSYSLTVIMLISGITQVFSISALPAVTTAWAQGNFNKLKSNVEVVLRVTTLVTIPSGLGLVALAKPIMELLYGNQGSKSEVTIASSVLIMLAIATIFASTSTPICSMLQAIGRVDLPVKLLAVGMAIKIVLNYVLVGIPQINIQGAGVGTMACYIFVTVLSFYFLCKETKMIPNLVSVFIKPLLAGVSCAVAAYLSYSLLSYMISAKVSTILALIISIIVYIVSLFLFKAVNAKDIAMLPKGEKIIKVLKKRKWIA